jgi:hypothetical protein
MKARRKPSPRQDRAAVERARRDLARATDALTARAAGVARVADRIGAAALEAERETLAAELVSDRILRDALELRDAFAVALPGTLPPGLEVLRKLPEAVLEWAQRRLGVQAYLRAGEELEVPADRLAGYELEGDARPAGGLVRVRIVAPGWKRAGRVLARPQAVLVGPPGRG